MTTEQPILSQQTITEACNDLRKNIKSIAGVVNDLRKEIIDANFDGTADWSEIIANITLAYRCLEDASMRCGKAIQAYDGGASVYDRETTVGA